MTYYLFERDLTSSHVSYHYCFLKYENVQFNNKSKIQEDYKYLYNILSNNLKDIKTLPSFHKAITPQNKFIESSYFHLSVNAINEQEYKLINKTFGLNTNYKYSYFTKLISDIGKETSFKCGFLLNEFSKINHKMKEEALDLAKSVGGSNYNILYAFDFDSAGNVIEDNINVEILPNYSKETFVSIKNVLYKKFSHMNVEYLEKYEKMFDGYTPSKFHFHFKVKLYADNKPTIKFYRTYNSTNPYIQ